MYDAIILGAGTAGLTAAIYAARAGLRFLVLEQDGWGGGQISAASQVQNYPGLPGISGAQLAENLRQHAIDMGARIQYGEINAVTQNRNGFTVSTIDGDTFDAKTVIAATGASPKLLGVPGEDIAGVSFCAICDGAFYAGKDVLVVGGGDAAVENALYLSSICRQVTVVIRRDSFRAAMSRVEKLKKLSNVQIITNSIVTELRGNEKVSSAILRTDGSTFEIAVDAVFLSVGTSPNTSYLASLPVLTSDGYVLADETGKTRVSGLFAAGDIRSKALYQAITAAADGANAATSAAAYVLEQSGYDCYVAGFQGSKLFVDFRCAYHNYFTQTWKACVRCDIPMACSPSQREILSQSSLEN
ncbi:MAG: FAD-dependent oxidoreductase [Eubacteriales bacterium]|nr:FAD-dependent oxidoreductase [Eubacteriales bacterium]